MFPLWADPPKSRLPLKSVYSEHVRGSELVDRAYLAPSVEFAGVACAMAAELRNPPVGGFPSDVYFTPITDPTDPNYDLAHSDFVTAAPSDDALDIVKERLATRLRVIRPAELADRLGNCALQASTTG